VRFNRSCPTPWRSSSPTPTPRLTVQVQAAAVAIVKLAPPPSLRPRRQQGAQV
jgi:hypothetical protein